MQAFIAYMHVYLYYDYGYRPTLILSTYVSVCCCFYWAVYIICSDDIVAFATESGLPVLTVNTLF